MDLEHPEITRTLKEGYPDGAGKPQQKNTNPPNYNRVEEDEQMEFEEYTVRELLDMEGRLEITFYKSNLNQAKEVMDKLGIDDYYESDFDDFGSLVGRYIDTKIYVIYGGVF